jgi:Cellulase (glycosyl hydrolase family 5)/Glycoside hydrolase family 5 C-terminal domain
VDFHQDIAGESYGGDGFPDWALNNDSQHSRFSFFGRLLDSHWGTNYYDVPWLSRMVCHCAGHRLQVRNTLESFWMDKLYNKDPKSPSTQMAQNPQTHFIGTVGQTVRFFASGNAEERDPAILGYEPFNEPDEVGIDKENFEQQFLPRFYHKVEAEIGKYDGEALVFIEPRVDWTVYSANGPEYQGLHFTLKPQTFLPAPYSPRAVNGVFSFHYYDPAMVAGIPFKRNMNRKAKEWPEIFRQMSDAADASGLVPFLTEFGCSQDWTSFTSLRPALYNHSFVRACMDLQFQQVEANLLNATYWNYDLYNRKKYNDNWRRENFSLLGPKRTPRNLDIVARPYPMRSSAKPERVFFDAESKNAAIILAGTVVDAPTVIYVPRSMHYSGNGFEVRATTSAASVVWDEKNQLLYWRPDKTLTENQIIISRSGGFDQKVLPAESLRLLPRTQYLMVVERDKKVPVACAASRCPAS